MFTMRVRDVHAESLATSTALSGYYVEEHIEPLDVIAVLNAGAVNFMLIGAHGLGGWTQLPRATQDVDIIVAARQHKRAIKMLLAAFPQLEASDEDVVTRLRDRDARKVVIDVVKPNQPLFRVALKHTQTVTSGYQEYKVPSLEMAVAMKFAPMVSPNRAEERKYQDAHDFILMVKSNPLIDMAKLAELGDLVYPEGGKEIVDMVERIRTGKKLNL